MSKKELFGIALGPLLLGCVTVAAILSWPRLSWVKVRSNPTRISCIANMKRIDGAIQHWALEQKLTVFNSYSFDDPGLLSYLKGSRLPVCPEGGIYVEGFNVTNRVSCTLAHKGHTL